MDDISFKTKMGDDFPKIIFSEDEIANRIGEIGKQITEDFKDKQEDGIIVLSVLKGAAVFMTDLVRAIDLKLTLDFMCVSSYANSVKTSGRPKILMDPSSEVNGKHIIIAEDIIDSGITMSFIIEYLKDKGAKSVTIVAFLHKHIAKKDIPVNYVCFDCPKEFIVGYGLDYKQYYRNLPYISGLGE